LLTVDFYLFTKWVTDKDLRYLRVSVEDAVACGED